MARKPRKITGKKRKPMSLAHRKAISLALARELGPTPTYDPYEKKGRKPGKHKNTSGGGSKASANKRARAAQNRKNGPKTVESVAAKKLPKNHVSGGGRQADPDFLNKDAIRQEPGYADTLDMQREIVKASPEARAAFMNQVKSARKAAQVDHGPDPENGEYGRNRAAQRRALHMEAMAEDMGLIKAENTRRAQDQADAVDDRAEEAKKRNEKRREQGLRERKAAQERNKKQREEAERKQRDAQADKADKDGKRDKAAQADKADQPAERKKQRAETKRKQREEQQRAENNAREATPEQREQQRRDAQREQRDKQEQALERAASERSAERRAQYANWDDDQLAEAHAAIMDKWGGDLDPAGDDGYDFPALAVRERDRKVVADLLDEMDDRAAERAGYTDNRDYGTVEAELEKHYALQAGAAEQDYYNQIAGDKQAETELRDHLAAASKKHTEREAEYKAQLDKLTAPEKGDTSDEAKAYRKLAKAHKEAGRLSKAAKNKHDELETHMRETYPDYDRPFYYTDHEELTELHDALAAVDDPDEDTARLIEQTRDELWFRDPSEIDGWASESIREMKNRVRKYGHDLTESEVIDRMAMAGNDRERVMNESGAFHEAYNDWLRGVLAEYARDWTHKGVVDEDPETFLSNLMYNNKNDGKNITTEKMLSNAMYARRASGEARRLFASLGYLPSRKNFMRTIRGETPPEYSEGRLREITTRGGKSDRRSRAKILMDQEISEAADAKNLRGRARAQFIKEEKQRRNEQQLKNLREQDEQRRADKAKAEAENATANATDTTNADKRTVTTDDGREIDMDTIPGAAKDTGKGMTDRVKAILEKQAAQRAESDTPESTAEKTARENGTTPKVENVAKAVAKAEADKPAKRGRPKLDGPTLGEQRAEATREQTARIDELKANRPTTSDPARAQWDYDMADARLQHAQAVERFERDRMAKLAAQGKPLTSVKKNIDKAQDAQTKAREARDNALTKARDKYGDDAAETIRTTGGYVAPAKKKRTRKNNADTARKDNAETRADRTAIHHDTIDEYVGGQPNPSAVKAIRDHAKELTGNDLRRAYAEASETAENSQGDKFANIPADTYRQELQKRRLYNPETGEVRDTPAPWGENEKGATEKVLSNPKARTGTMGKMLDRHEREYADALEKEGMAPAKAKAKAARERADYEKKLAAANNADAAPADAATRKGDKTQTWAERRANYTEKERAQLAELKDNRPSKKSANRPQWEQDYAEAKRDLLARQTRFEEERRDELKRDGKSTKQAEKNLERLTEELKQAEVTAAEKEAKNAHKKWQTYPSFNKPDPGVHPDKAPREWKQWEVDRDEHALEHAKLFLASEEALEDYSRKRGDARPYNADHARQELKEAEQSLEKNRRELEALNNATTDTAPAAKAPENTVARDQDNAQHFSHGAPTEPVGHKLALKRMNSAQAKEQYDKGLENLDDNTLGSLYRHYKNASRGTNATGMDELTGRKNKQRTKELEQALRDRGYVPKDLKTPRDKTTPERQAARANNAATTKPAAPAKPENKVDVKPEDYQGKDTLLVWDGSRVRKFDAKNWNGKPTTTPMDRNPEAARAELESMAKKYPNSAVIMAHEKNTFGLKPEHRKEADEYNESVRQLLKDVQKATEKRAAEVEEERRQKRFDNARKAYEEADARRAEAVERSRNVPPVDTSDLDLNTPLGQAERDYREADRAATVAEAMRDAIVAKGDQDTYQAHMAAADRGNNTPESRKYHRDRVQETVKEAQDAEVRADQRVKDAYAARDEARRVRDNAQRDVESMSDMSGSNGLQAAAPTPRDTETDAPERAEPETPTTPEGIVKAVAAQLVTPEGKRKFQARYDSALNGAGGWASEADYQPGDPEYADDMRSLRQNALNDAMLDMAEGLGVDPEALFMDSELTPRMWARATDPDKLARNMMKRLNAQNVEYLRGKLESQAQATPAAYTIDPDNPQPRAGRKALHFEDLPTAGAGSASNKARKIARKHAESLSDENLIDAYQQARADYNNATGNRNAGVRNAYVKELKNRRLYEPHVTGDGAPKEPQLTPLTWGNGMERYSGAWKHPDKRTDKDRAGIDVYADDYVNALVRQGENRDDAKRNVRRQIEQTDQQLRDGWNPLEKERRRNSPRATTDAPEETLAQRKAREEAERTARAERQDALNAQNAYLQTVQSPYVANNGQTFTESEDVNLAREISGMDGTRGERIKQYLDERGLWLNNDDGVPFKVEKTRELKHDTKLSGKDADGNTHHVKTDEIRMQFATVRKPAGGDGADAMNGQNGLQTATPETPATPESNTLPDELAEMVRTHAVTRTQAERVARGDYTVPPVNEDGTSAFTEYRMNKALEVAQAAGPITAETAPAYQVLVDNVRARANAMMNDRSGKLVAEGKRRAEMADGIQKAIDDVTSTAEKLDGNAFIKPLPAAPERTTTPKPETATVDGADEINGRLWEKNGRSRTYINGWETAAGFEINRYKTGNVRSAYFNGRKISNNRASQAVAGRRVYVDNNTGELHVDGLDNLTIDGETYDVFDQIAAAIKASGEVGDMELKRPGTTAPAAAQTTGETRDRTDNVVTFRRINGDEWGVTGTGLQVGDVVTARNRKGREKPVTIVEIVTDTDGKQVARFEDNKGRKRAPERDAEQAGNNAETPARTAQAQPATPPTLPEGHDPYTGERTTTGRAPETEEEQRALDNYLNGKWSDFSERLADKRELKRMGLDARDKRERERDAARAAYKPTAAEKKWDSAGLYFNGMGAWETSGYMVDETRLLQPGETSDEEYLFTIGRQEVYVPAGGMKRQVNGKVVVNGTDMKTGKPVTTKSDEYGRFGKPLITRYRPTKFNATFTPQNYHAKNDLDRKYPNRPNTGMTAEAAREAIKRQIADRRINADPAMSTAPTITEREVDEQVARKVAHKDTANNRVVTHVIDNANEVRNHGAGRLAQYIVGSGGNYYTATPEFLKRSFLDPDVALADMNAKLVDNPEARIHINQDGDLRLAKVDKIESFNYGYRLTGTDEKGDKFTEKISRDSNELDVWLPLAHENGEPYTRAEAEEYAALQGRKEAAANANVSLVPEQIVWGDNERRAADAALHELRKRGGELNFDDADEVDGLPDTPAPAPLTQRERRNAERRRTAGVADVAKQGREAGNQEWKKQGNVATSPRGDIRENGDGTYTAIPAVPVLNDEQQFSTAREAIDYIDGLPTMDELAKLAEAEEADAATPPIDIVYQQWPDLVFQPDGNLRLMLETESDPMRAAAIRAVLADRGGLN